MKRRLFIKGTVATSTFAAAGAAGLITTQTALAENTRSAFGADNKDAVISALFGDELPADSAHITLKAPEVAENGAVVPIKVTTSSPAEMIAIVVEENPSPLALTAKFEPGTNGYLSGRIKMGKTSNVIAYARINGELIKTAVEVKVTAGGCGG